jgi:YHS domain-containing protein
MAKAKCKICGTELDTKTAYKVTDKNGKNKYFCNEAEFEAEEKRKKNAQEDKDRVYYLI